MHMFRGIPQRMRNTAVSSDHERRMRPLAQDQQRLLHKYIKLELLLSRAIDLLMCVHANASS